MADVAENLKCLRCASQMILDPEWYTVPRHKSRNLPQDNIIGTLEHGRMVRLYRCDKCQYVELRVPDGWPNVSAVRG